MDEERTGDKTWLHRTADYIFIRRDGRVLLVFLVLCVRCDLLQPMLSCSTDVYN